MIEGAMDHMLKNGTVVWLDLPLKMIIDRLKQKKDRPLLQGKKVEELEAFIKAHFAERQSQYAKAHIKFDASDLNSEKLHRLHEEIHSR
jgi:shikimate kinase